MSHSILLIVPKPDKHNVQANQLWEYLPHKFAELTNTNKDLQVIGEGVLLIPIDKTLNSLSLILSEITKTKLSYNYLILPEETKIHEVVEKV